MWMLYAEQHWTKDIGLKSSVERLYEKLGALEFDADHEAIYEMERKFKEGKYRLLCLVHRLNEVGLQYFFDTIKHCIKDCSNLDTSSSDGKESKAVE
ncbi:hypothetical protein FQA39_LY17709 [Lamprigera yunnana]|nr:hypothetical protein FQA39_LY17709 [Lamprigera yunnana]